jgi:hypothetical protein
VPKFPFFGGGLMPSTSSHSDHHCAVYPGARIACRAHLRARNKNNYGRKTPMKLPRRIFLHLAAGAAALPSSVRKARRFT